MDEQTEAVGVRRRRSHAEIGQLVAEYESSGLGRLEFCQKRGLSLATLARYRKRQGRADTPSESRWLAVEVCAGGEGFGAARDSGLAVELAGGRRIEIGRGFDAETLVQLLRVLERS